MTPTLEKSSIKKKLSTDFHDFLTKRLEQYNIKTQEVSKSENYFLMRSREKFGGV